MAKTKKASAPETATAPETVTEVIDTPVVEQPIAGSSDDSVIYQLVWDFEQNPALLATVPNDLRSKRVFDKYLIVSDIQVKNKKGFITFGADFGVSSIFRSSVDLKHLLSYTRTAEIIHHTDMFNGFNVLRVSADRSTFDLIGKEEIDATIDLIMVDVKEAQADRNAQVKEIAVDVKGNLEAYVKSLIEKNGYKAELIFLNAAMPADDFQSLPVTEQYSKIDISVLPVDKQYNPTPEEIAAAVDSEESVQPVKLLCYGDSVANTELLDQPTADSIVAENEESFLNNIFEQMKHWAYAYAFLKLETNQIVKGKPVYEVYGLFAGLKTNFMVFCFPANEAKKNFTNIFGKEDQIYFCDDDGNRFAAKKWWK